MIGPRSQARRGTLLVIVIGLIAVVISLAVAFLARMRSDGEEGMRFAQDIQARIMLSAGLMYVQEGSRLGWGGKPGDPSNPVDEAYGWRDVRDGMPGPRLFDGQWPIALRGVIHDDGTGAPYYPAIGGRAARCPMYRMRRPPYAISPNITPNPVALDGPNGLTASWSQLINFTNPDPAPDPEATTWQLFRDGDPKPVDNDSNPAWFRVYRSTALRFIITCGAGATRGYKTYQEAVDAGEGDYFGSQASFDDLRGRESLFWYEAEWSDIVTGNNFLNTHYGRWNQRYYGRPDEFGDAQPNMRQQGGTFSYIEKLPDYPPQW